MRYFFFSISIIDCLLLYTTFDRMFVTLLILQDGIRNTGLPPLEPSLVDFDYTSLQVGPNYCLFFNILETMT